MPRRYLPRKQHQELLDFVWANPGKTISELTELFGYILVKNVINRGDLRIDGTKVYAVRERPGDRSNSA